MNTHFHRHALRSLLVFAVAAPLLVTNTPALAAPGAHGPDGEHLDGPAALRAASTLPRVEAKSETFELVAELRASELTIVVDRYETNEPVLGANLEVESGTLKAVAAFRAEQGDYAATDAAMLKALAAPGEHGLVFTLVAGQDSDLLDGTLVRAGGRVAATAAKNDHELARAAWIGAGIAALSLMCGIAWWRQRRREVGKQRGGL